MLNEFNLYQIAVCRAYLTQDNPWKKAKLYSRYSDTINYISGLLKEYEEYSRYLTMVYEWKKN